MSFELVNKDAESWTKDQFVESDPYRQETRANIVLLVDWEAQDAIVETEYASGSTTMRQWNHLDQTFNLPENLDATLFVDYYNTTIKPLLEARGEYFESYWNGHNIVGRFTDISEDDANIYRFDSDISEACDNAPEFDEQVYWDIDESFQCTPEIIDFLKPAIDFMSCNLDDDKIVSSIVGELTDNCVFVDDIDADDLKKMREKIIEYTLDKYSDYYLYDSGSEVGIGQEDEIKEWLEGIGSNESEIKYICTLPEYIYALKDDPDSSEMHEYTSTGNTKIDLEYGMRWLRNCEMDNNMRDDIFGIILVKEDAKILEEMAELADEMLVMVVEANK